MRMLAHHEKRLAKTKTGPSAEMTRVARRANNPTANYNGSIMHGNSANAEVNTISDAIRERPWDTILPGSGDLAVATPLPAAEPTKRSSVRKQLEGLWKQRDAELVLDLKNIRKKLNFVESRAADNDERPRKRVKREVVRCQCHVAIWDNREGFVSPEPIVKRTQLCSITTRDGPFDDKVVDIEMDEAITINAAELLVPVTTKGTLKMALGDKYFLETKIIPTESVDIWPPISILSKSENSSIEKLGKKSIETVQGALVSSYANLPQAPASNVPLSVSFVQDGRTFKTKYGLEVSATWRVRNGSEAEIKTEKELSLDRSLLKSLPSEQNRSGQQDGDDTIPYRPEIKTASKKVKLWYNFSTGSCTSMTLDDGYRCIICPAIKCRSLDDLLFHLMTYHHKYKYSAEPKPGEPNRVEIKVELADPERKKPLKTTKNPDKEFEWLAPKEPFDKDAYLDGDRSWLGIESQKPTKGPKVLIQNGNLPTTSLTSSQRPLGFLPAEQVQEIPTPNRRRFPVIPSKTRGKTPFFRSVSHRPMRLDENPLSESDDEMDDSWIRDKHRERILEQQDLNPAEKEFQVKWDLHVMAEHFPHGRYISDTLVRFVRKERGCLRRERGVYREFLGLVGELKEQGVVDDRVLKGCLGVIWDNREGVEEANDMARGIDRENYSDSNCHAMKARPDTTSRACDTADESRLRSTSKGRDVDCRSSAAQTPDDDSLETSSLVAVVVKPRICGCCFLTVRRATQAIACSEANCKTPGKIYHQACIGQKPQLHSWVCPACYTSAVEAELLVDEVLKKEKEREFCE